MKLFNWLPRRRGWARGPPMFTPPFLVVSIPFDKDAISYQVTKSHLGKIHAFKSTAELPVSGSGSLSGRPPGSKARHGLGCQSVLGEEGQLGWDQQQGRDSVCV